MCLIAVAVQYFRNTILTDNVLPFVQDEDNVLDVLDIRIYKYLDQSPPINQPYKTLPPEVKSGRHLLWRHLR